MLHLVCLTTTGPGSTHLGLRLVPDLVLGRRPLSLAAHLNLLVVLDDGAAGQAEGDHGVLAASALDTVPFADLAALETAEPVR